LVSDSNLYELQVFEVKAVKELLARGSREHRQVVRPFRSVQRHTFSSEDAGITQAVWSDDSREVLFLSAADAPSKGRRDLQLFRLELESGVVQQITRHNHPITGFQYRGKGLVFTDSALQPVADRVPAYPMEPVQRTEYGDVVLSRWRTDVHDSRALVAYGNAEPQLLEGYTLEAVLANDGRRAILRQLMPSLNTVRFVMVDLEQGKLFPDVSAWYPAERVEKPAYKVLWSHDDRHAVLVNVGLEPMHKEDSPSAQPQAVIADYDTDARRLEMIEPLVVPMEGGPARTVTSVDWMEGGQELLVTHEIGGQRSSGTVYAMTAGRWVGREVSPSIRPSEPSADESSANGIEVRLRQGANEPPIVVASDGKHELALQSPDPALQGIWRAPLEPYQFTGADGKVVTAGLMLPRDFKKGSPIPVVIQTVEYRPEFFLPDGPNSTAFAAQTLSARGMGVIQIETNAVVQRERGKENTDYDELIQSAVDSLVQAGIADPDRIGMIGFSHSGFDTYYAITHPGPKPLAAAVCADSYTGSYLEYLPGLATNGPEELEPEFDYGGPFWKHKTEWLERETTFNVDRVQTPALFSQNGPGDVAGDPGYAWPSLNTIGAFLANKKPLEYLYFPEGAHQLQRPRERLAMMESVVDWMSFWLQGKEDPSPDKASQYARWRPMRSWLTQKQ
jgi:hypothetical protein